MGINHDPARWPEPGSFDPTRFEGVMPGPFDLVAQGGGDISGHRCPGEDLALRLLGVTLGILAVVDYEVADSPSVDRGRIPTLPDGGLRIRVGGGASRDDAFHQTARQLRT
jgi:fatty-acid peroxygenase